MANNDLTNHEIYDSFYASDEERAAFEAAASQRGACIRRFVVGILSGCSFGALLPFSAVVYQDMGIDSMIPFIAPPILMILYSFSGFLGIYFDRDPISPSRALTKNDPVKMGGARQMCRAFAVGMASVASVPILEVVLDELAPDLTFLRFILPVVCVLFAVDGLVQMISGHGLWRLCALRYRALLDKKTEAYLAAHPGRRLYTADELPKDVLALPLRRSRARRILLVFLRAALAAAAVAAPVVVLDLGPSWKEIISCVAFFVVCLLLQLLMEPWLPAKHDIAIRRAQIRMYKRGILTDQRDLMGLAAENKEKEAQKQQEKQNDHNVRLQAEYDALTLKYPGLKTIPVSAMGKNQRKMIEKSVKKRKHIIVFSICGAWALAGAVMLIVSKVILIEGIASVVLMALGITAFAIAFFTMIHGNLIAVAFRNVSDNAILAEEFRLARKGEEFIGIKGKEPNEKEEATAKEK